MTITDGTKTVDMPISERYVWLDWQYWDAIFRIKYGEYEDETGILLDWFQGRTEVSVNGADSVTIEQLHRSRYDVDPQATYWELRLSRPANCPKSPFEELAEKRDALIAAIRKAAIDDACYALDWIARKCDALRLRLEEKSANQQSG